MSSSRTRVRGIMSMEWHVMMADEPSLVGCMIWDQNYSRELVRTSKESVIDVPKVDLVKTVTGIGNYHGPER